MYKEIHIHDITWPCHKITYDTIAMIKKQCKGHLQFYRMFVTVSMMIVRDVSRDIWYLMIFKIVFNHHLSWCQRFMIQASGCLWWYFFHFSLCFCLKAWRINGKAGEKCSNYRSYDLTHQRDWKSLKILKIEMVCCLKSKKTTPLLSVVFCGWTLVWDTIEKIFSDVIFACRGCFLFLRSCHDVANSQPILVAKALKSS